MPKITLVRPGLWLVEADLENFQVRGVVMNGTLGSVIWDTLARPRDMEGVAGLTGGLPLSVVYSHGDWDHVWGTGGIERPWSEVIAHRLCAHRFREELPKTLQEKQSESPGTYAGIPLVAPTLTFQDTLTLELGGATLELHSLPGHTHDSVVGFVPEWGVFLAGDAVETPLPFLNPDSPTTRWKEGLEAWLHRLERAENPSVVIPSHGKIGGLELLRENVRYLKDLLEGTGPTIPHELPQFYRETHDRNLSLARDL